MHNREGSWFELGVQLLLISSLLGIFYGVFIAHSLFARVEKPEITDLGTITIVQVRELNIPLDHLCTYDENVLTVNGREIPASDYRVSCSDDDLDVAHIEFPNSLLLDREIESYTFHSYNSI